MHELFWVCGWHKHAHTRTRTHLVNKIPKIYLGGGYTATVGVTRTSDILWCTNGEIHVIDLGSKITEPGVNLTLPADYSA